MDQHLKQTMARPQVGYSMVWEDHALLAKGLGLRAGDRVLSIGSAGCNTFNMLLEAPLFVDVIDVNPAQLALIELKTAAIRSMDHSDFLDLLLTPRAHQLYRRLRPQLTFAALDFFDNNESVFTSGVLKCGRLDLAFRRFREHVLPHFWPARVLHALRNCETLAEQNSLLAATDLTGLGNCVEDAFGLKALAEMRSQAQMAYVQNPNPGRELFARFIRLTKTGLIRDNFYLWFFLTGELPPSEEAHPPYLRAKNFGALRHAIRRMDVHLTDLESLLTSPGPLYNKMNLSDVFEYMSNESAQRLFSAAAHKLEPGGRIAFWNLFVERAPEIESLRVETALNDLLSSHERVCFYQSFKVASKVAF
ncbi:MAG TPA: DUF3419 family protein [Bdellovibrionales bacterium]|nr:DUF3419 family protein [Bdellovibrionales bacterium]